MIVCYSPISIIRSLNHSTSGSARSVLLLVPSVCFFKRDYAKYPDAHIYKPHFNEHTKIRGRTNPFLPERLAFSRALNPRGTEDL